MDVNVERVRRRTGATFSARSAQALMDLGATVCLARIPRCDACPLAPACPSRGIREEPARKQGPFEGSFRQRRAAALRLVAQERRAARRARRRGRPLARAGRPRRRGARARRAPFVGPSCIRPTRPMEHPDVRLDVRADAVLDERASRGTRERRTRRRPGTACRSTPPSRRRLPRITIDRGAAATISPPTRSWMRIQGSKCDPSSRRHSMYVSIGMSG